jgi:hypothetical protein
MNFDMLLQHAETMKFFLNAETMKFLHAVTACWKSEILTCCYNMLKQWKFYMLLQHDDIVNFFMLLLAITMTFLL